MHAYSCFEFGEFAVNDYLETFKKKIVSESFPTLHFYGSYRDCTVPYLLPSKNTFLTKH